MFTHTNVLNVVYCYSHTVRSQATNPPPVSGEAIMREEEFYIAEDHTYAAVNKKAKKKKKLKNLKEMVKLRLLLSAPWLKCRVTDLCELRVSQTLN